MSRIYFFIFDNSDVNAVYREKILILCYTFRLEHCLSKDGQEDFPMC